MTKMFTSAALFIFLIILSACGGISDQSTQLEDFGKIVTVENGNYREVSISDFQKMQNEKDFVLVNVHIPFEGDIPDTDTSFPFNEIQQNLGLLPEDKNSKIILYCRSDRMSGIAAEELVSLGYTNIWSLKGGFNAWIQAGLPFAAD